MTRQFQLRKFHSHTHARPGSAEMQCRLFRQRRRRAFFLCGFRRVPLPACLAVRAKRMLCEGPAFAEGSVLQGRSTKAFGLNSWAVGRMEEAEFLLEELHHRTSQQRHRSSDSASD